LTFYFHQKSFFDECIGMMTNDFLENYHYTLKKPDLISAVIIDDVPMCSLELQDMIVQGALGIEIIATCDNAEDGLIKIQESKPDLVFLDVEMPGMNGFEMIRKVPVVNFEIIFTTAYDNYAIKAIRFQALDYLTKPIDATDLAEAIIRLREKRERSHLSEKALEVIGHHTERKLDNLAVPTMEGLMFIVLEDIVRCESNSKYTTIFLLNNKKIISSRTLGDFEDILQHHGFFRIHKSYLINLKHLKKYLRGEGGQVVMSDGAVLEISRRKKDELLSLVSQF